MLRVIRVKMLMLRVLLILLHVIEGGLRLMADRELLSHLVMLLSLRGKLLKRLCVSQGD